MIDIDLMSDVTRGNCNCATQRIIGQLLYILPGCLRREKNSQAPYPDGGGYLRPALALPTRDVIRTAIVTGLKGASADLKRPSWSLHHFIHAYFIDNPWMILSENISAQAVVGKGGRTSDLPAVHQVNSAPGPMEGSGLHYLSDFLVPPRPKFQCSQPA